HFLTETVMDFTIEMFNRIPEVVG
ncbi:MAG TPA: flagellar export apparatus protein FliQ, partial [Idiomarina loihiensis]|nr:flagellar export apparatus protein FliQ [Idiomarina loihiensis]